MCLLKEIAKEVIHIRQHELSPGIPLQMTPIILSHHHMNPIIPLPSDFVCPPTQPETYPQPPHIAP
jgi:hypothetical protein